MNNETYEYSPILAVRQYLGAKAEPVTAHMAHVLVTTKGEHRIVWPHDRAHSVVWQHTRSNGLFRGRVKTVYDIDLGVRHLKFEETLPGKDDTFSFKASAVIHWRVLDPSLVVRNQLRDIRLLIQPAITDEIRRIARQYEVNQSADAEHSINERLAGEDLDFNDPQQLGNALAMTVKTGHIGREYGLWTRTIVSVQPDQSRLEQYDKLRDLRHQIEIERLEQELRRLRQQNDQQLIGDRMEFYREAFASGDIERAVLEVAQNPDEITTVMRVVREQELAGQRHTIDFVNKLLETGTIERWQVNDQAKAALDWLRQSTSTVFTPQLQGASANDENHQRKRVRRTPLPETDAPMETAVAAGDAVPTGD